MPPSLARAGVPFLLVLLFVGTLMPGAWKTAAIDRVGSPLDLAALAHVGVFAGLAFLVGFTRWWGVRAWHIAALGVALALLTEGLQFFAVDRHPNAAGVVQDLAGTALGWWAARAWRKGLRALPPPGGST